MIKKLGLTGIALSALLLSGCGGGGDDTDPMDDKNYIAIIANVETGICESDALRSELTNAGITGLLLRETDNTTTCGTYGKANDGNECAIEYIGNGTFNCVIGFDDVPADFDGFARQVGPVELADTLELISGSF